MNSPLFPSLFQTPALVRRLVAVGSTVQYEWFTPWSIAAGVDSIRPVWKNQVASSNFVSQIVIETAPVRTDDPSTTLTTLGSTLTGNNASCPGNLTVSTQTGGALWFRLGIAYSSNNAAIAQADVSLQAAWNQAGCLVDQTTVRLEANDTGIRIAAVSRWFPAIYASYLKAAYIGEGLTGGTQLQFRLATQTADTSVDSPNAWNTSFDTWRAFSANLETNTGDVTFSPGSAMWVRAGIAYQLASGTRSPTAA